MEKLIDLLIKLTKTTNISINPDSNGKLELYPIFKELYERGLINDSTMTEIEVILNK